MGYASVTPVVNGTVEGDGTGESAFEAFEQVNSNESGMVSAINGYEFTVDVETVADQDYVLWWDAPFAGTVTKIRTKSQSGTCTLTGKVNTTALGGTANSVSSTATEQVHGTSNTFVKGDKILFTISANSACTDMAVAVYGDQTA